VAGVGINELGRISLTYKLEMEALEDIIYEDNRSLEKDYFDPFVKDQVQISKVRLFFANLGIEPKKNRRNAQKKRRGT